MNIFSEEMTCRQQNELYTKGQSSKPCGETGWGMCSNIPERPNVLPFTVSPRKDMNVLGQRSEEGCSGNPLTPSSPLGPEGHVFGKGKGLWKWAAEGSKEDIVVFDTGTKGLVRVWVHIYKV